MKKDFKYTIRTKSGLMLAQSIVTFGSKKYPFPDDWENSGMAQRAIQDHKEVFLNENFNVTVEDSSEMDDWATYVEIEEVAQKEYPKKSMSSIPLRKAFCNGAKSEAARQYWFEVFKQQENENRINIIE